MPNDRADQSAQTLPLPDDIEGVFDQPDEGSTFPIVGVGASAGGLEAFAQLLKALPSDTGMSFVLVQHLAPTHPSALAEILARATKNASFRGSRRTDDSVKSRLRDPARTDDDHRRE